MNIITNREKIEKSSLLGTADKAVIFDPSLNSSSDR